MLNTISPVPPPPPEKKSFFDYLISITKWPPIAILKNFKFDNSGTKQAMKRHNIYVLFYYFCEDKSNEIVIFLIGDYVDL